MPPRNLASRRAEHPAKAGGFAAGSFDPRRFLSEVLNRVPTLWLSWISRQTREW